MTTKEMLSSALSVKLAELKTRPYSALQTLPKSSEETIPGLKRGGLQIWIDEQQGQSLKVTVQAYKNYFLGVGVSKLGGFRIFKDGAVHDLKLDELK